MCKIRRSLDFGPRRQQGHTELQKPSQSAFNPPGKQAIWNWFFLLKDPVIVLTFSERVDNEFSGQFNEVSPENLHNMKSLDKIERAYFVFPEW